LHGAGRIADRGALQLRTARHPTGPEASRKTGSSSGPWICVNVSDSGPPAVDAPAPRWLEQARLFAEKYKGTLSTTAVGSHSAVSLWLPLVVLED
jgi:hypothetical protein